VDTEKTDEKTAEALKNILMADPRNMLTLESRIK
jgi:hypothetical protein